MADKTYDYSVVVECDNFKQCDPRRSIASLQALFTQMRHDARNGEALLVVPPGADTKLLQEVIRDSGSKLETHLIDTPEDHYFTLKNIGLRAAKGSIIICMDSDVIPERDWLATMLRSFDRNDVQIVAGSTYIEPTDLYYKTMSLALCFPLRDERETMYEGERFFANNIAGRRSTWLQFPFPEETTRMRGQQIDLEAAFKNNGIIVWQQPASRVMHPPPNGIVHFIHHAIAEGFDAMMTWRQSYTVFVSLGHFAFWLKNFLITRNWIIIRDHKKAHLSLAAVPIALLINSAYYCIAALAAVLTLVSPALVRKMGGK